LIRARRVAQTLCQVPEEPSLARGATKFRITADEATLWIKHLTHDTATKLNLSSFSLLDQAAAWHSVDDRDEFPHLTSWALAPFAETSKELIFRHITDGLIFTHHLISGLAVSSP
jgi:hypothetical protein